MKVQKKCLEDEQEVFNNRKQKDFAIFRKQDDKSCPRKVSC